MRTRDELLDQLEACGSLIEQSFTSANPRCVSAARDVVKYYEMWYRCPGDNMAMVLTEKAFDVWLKERDVLT